ncbi:hypothetical protein GBAR_LOCUS25781 [Geodia barretti]|uniref:Uncharacterized protein n=1 Tax=Geodia barretti TaxID=519541 RepID=A0AA35TGC3_GEOBA|nr:hypothetical protein GBAR_LOCUS25781 [Geodia barretti]
MSSWGNNSLSHCLGSNWSTSGSTCENSTSYKERIRAEDKRREVGDGCQCGLWYS